MGACWRHGKARARRCATPQGGKATRPTASCLALIGDKPQPARNLQHARPPVTRSMLLSAGSPAPP